MNDSEVDKEANALEFERSGKVSLSEFNRSRRIIAPAAFDYSKDFTLLKDAIADFIMAVEKPSS